LIENAPAGLRVSTSDDLDTFQILKKSIESEGLMSPILVLSHKDKYIVLSGHRRVKAFKELYASTRDDQYLEIPSKVFYIKETFKDNFFKNLKDI
jgi:ParB family chromosome partitioning protein